MAVAGEGRGLRGVGMDFFFFVTTAGRAPI